MIQPTFTSSRILLPVRPGFIWFSLALGLLLNFLPTAHWPGVPDWVALVLTFWCIRESRYVGMGWAFALGLCMDVADGAVLGQHAFAYVLLAYTATRQARRILWFPLAQQAIHRQTQRQGSERQAFEQPQQSPAHQAAQQRQHYRPGQH